MGWGGARPNSGPRRKPDQRQKPRQPAPARFVTLDQQKALSLNSPQAVASIMALIEASGQTKRNRFPVTQPFTIDHAKMHPPGAIPPAESGLRLAMDDAINWAASGFAGVSQLGAFTEGLEFLGYPYLAQLAQRAEYRSIVDTIATEMTRKWISFKGTGDVDKTVKIKELNDYLDSLNARERFGESAALDGYFGRTHLYLDLFGDDRMLDRDPKWDQELKTSIGNGSDTLSDGKLSKGCLKRLQTVEPTWTYPTTYNATSPLRSDWYRPQQWYVMGKQLHCTRLLTFVGRPLPDQLKPAYSFGGLALTQMAKPYVDIWLTTRQSVADLIHSFSVMVLMTDLQSMMQPGGASNILARAALFNALRDNQGLFLGNKATEEFKNVSAPLSGLDHLQAQSQEHVMSVVHIPAVIYTGIQPSGLNASSEGEIRVFYDMIKAYQNKFFRPNLNTVIDIAMISLWGARDPDITYDFVPLWELSEKEKSEKRKIEADTDAVYLDGVISTEEVRTRLANDPESPYHGIDPEDVPDLEEEEEETGFVPGKTAAGEKDGKERDGASDQRKRRARTRDHIVP